MPFKEKEFHKEENCLNCGYPLIGKFCGNCGQKANFHKDSFLHMAAHFVGDYFHYDSKFWTTIKTLFTKPGLVTLEYINGKRAKYLNPIQLYIFVSTIFFLVFFASSLGDDSHDTKKENHKETSKKDSTQSNNTEEEIEYTDQTKGYDSRQAKSNVDLADSDKFVRLKLEDTTKLSEAEKLRVRKALKRNKIEKLNIGGNNSVSMPLQYDSLKQYDSAQASLSMAERDGMLKRYFKRKTYIINEKYENGDQVGDAFQEKLFHNIPKAFFLLLPLFAFLLKIFFNRKNLFYVDHIIFSLHFHSVIFILFIFPELIYMINSNFVYELLLFIFFIGVGIYLSLALKRTYPSPWYKIILKQIGLTFLYFICFLIMLIGMLFITIILL